jgi:very-short-patch-repair endonuclease
MHNKHLITQQPISPVKLGRAKKMRHEMTPAESKLWAQLRNNRLEGFHFRRQQIIGPYIVDFYCNPAALVIEVDGGVHLEQQEYDRVRDLDLQSIGLRVLHFWNSDVNENIDAVLDEILQACRDLPLTPPC